MKLMKPKTAMIHYASMTAFSIGATCVLAWKHYLGAMIYYWPVVALNIILLVASSTAWRAQRNETRRD